MFDDRRSFMAVSGAALTVPAWQYIAHMKDTPQLEEFDRVLGARYSTTKATPASIEYFNSLIGTFRRLDDVEGGSEENLKRISATIGQVAHYLTHGTFTDRGLTREMTGVLAQVSQIGGWMAYDAEHHGLAQRYFRTGLHAAHSIGDLYRAKTRCRAGD
ncbi:MAG TPA: hypothetical protein VJT72_01845 [Pseudonocardiaceae bacterium]|nr:hypothetical protein [Pseudonocardiaceae bacterium]